MTEQEDRFGACLRVSATNDRNGNPRRAYVFINDHGDIYRVVNEGYAGIGAIKEYLTDEVTGTKHYYPGTINVTPREYRELMKWKGEPWTA